LTAWNLLRTTKGCVTKSCYHEFECAQLTPSQKHLAPVNEGALSAFYNDMSEEEGRKYLATLTTQSQDSFETKSEFATSELEIPRWYIVTEKDQAIPVFAQDAMLAGDESFKTFRLDSGHSPMMSQPDKVLEIVKEISSL
jgi:pimeloyl-ACP methyl ester carboxylesterase